MQKINFPLLKTFDVDSHIVDFLNDKFEEYTKTRKLIPAENIVYISETGGFTLNLLTWDNKEYKNFLNTIIVNLISECLCLSSENFYLHYTHFFDYKEGGYVKEHKHDEHEDYVFIFYLNNCNSGNTIFFPNASSDYDKERTHIKVRPSKDRGVCFSSILLHKSEYTNEPKRLFVVGVKIK